MTANTATAEAIMEAIRKEEEARLFYLAAAARVKNPLVRRRILGLAEDELEHRQTLSRLFWAQTGTEPGPVSVGRETAPGEEAAGMGMEEILRLALREELSAVRAYRSLAARVSDERERLFLEYLVDFEQSHADLLQRELDLLEKIPDWVHLTEGEAP